MALMMVLKAWGGVTAVDSGPIDRQSIRRRRVPSTIARARRRSTTDSDDQKNAKRVSRIVELAFRHPGVLKLVFLFITDVRT